MSGPRLDSLAPGQDYWPEKLAERLGPAAPDRLWFMGRAELTAARKTALFCSVRAPGRAVLQAQETAHALRDRGLTVISGFHSPLEKECLRILLKGGQPVIYCLARGLENMRLPRNLRQALDAGRLLILSPFADRPRRLTAASARRRNDLVAALADDAVILYAEPGGEVDRIRHLLDQWLVGKPEF